MALNLSLVGACQALRLGSNEIFRTGNNFMSPVGTTQMLLDPRNRNGFKTTAEAGQTGHFKTVEYFYQQRALEAEVRTAKSCTAGTAEPRIKQTTQIQLYREIATTVAEDDIRMLCEAQSQFVNLGSSRSAGSAQLQVMREVAEQLYLKEEALAIAINRATNVALAAETGTYQGGATTKTYEVMTSEDYSLLPKGLIDMKYDLGMMGFSGQALVSGAGNIEKALISGEYGCCNSGLGIDYGRMAANPGFQFYKDDLVGVAAVLNNANAFFAVLPGTAQFITYNQYVGNFAGEMIGGDVVRGTIPSTYFPGVNYDVRIFPDGCAETYTVIMGLWFDVWTPPADLFKVGDRFRGINGVVKGIAAATVAA